jgi:hypothetical protein
MSNSQYDIDGSGMSDADLKGIPSNVTSLSLDGAKITDKGISNLPFLHSIKSLNLNSTLITDKSIEIICKFITLENLWLDNVNLSNEYTLEPLTNLNFLSFGGDGKADNIDYLKGNLGFRRT